jgi:hypothetical protein
MTAHKHVRSARQTCARTPRIDFEPAWICARDGTVVASELHDLTANIREDSVILSPAQPGEVRRLAERLRR